MKLAILGVDPGEQCGVACMFGDELGEHCLLDGYDAIAIGVRIRDFLAACELHGFVGVLVMEKPPKVSYGTKGGKLRSLNGAGSVIGCRKLWVREWKRAGAVARRVVSVEPNTWRARIFSGTSRMKSDALKALAIHRVRAEYGVQPATSDVAEAVLVAKWGTHAPAVRSCLPKTLRVTP